MKLHRGIGWSEQHCGLRVLQLQMLPLILVSKIVNHDGSPFSKLVTVKQSSCKGIPSPANLKAAAPPAWGQSQLKTSARCGLPEFKF